MSVCSFLTVRFLTLYIKFLTKLQFSENTLCELFSKKTLPINWLPCMSVYVKYDEYVICVVKLSLFYCFCAVFWRHLLVNWMMMINQWLWLEFSTFLILFWCPLKKLQNNFVILLTAVSCAFLICQFCSISSFVSTVYDAHKHKFLSFLLTFTDWFCLYSSHISIAFFEY